ncbi:DUF3332 domain-containing protein [Bacteroides sp. 51]|uniref:DUF3332 domain-containing protein n=1 Tax=Bacteroides sp. 51 TaxID=2302938 RepID=UPI0013D1C8A8|nr:DUF3332 domain-containing protein [Bacteroides sp. 51]NDV81944.1 DUF3332 domain-containing protein [Bacteroides sp. 51]
MKRSKSSLALVCVLCSSILFSSCIGSFALFNKVKTWNQGIGNKFVNELVFVALNIVPVYGVVYLADILVINSIEFWSGDNPVASVGEVKTVKGENGDYLVETLENGYSITNENGDQAMELLYNKEANTWSVVSDGVSSDLIKINDDGTAQLYLPDGNSMNVTLDAQGVLAAREVTMSTLYVLNK